MAEKKHLKQRINEGEVIIGAIVGWDTGSDRLKEILDLYHYNFFS